MGPTARCNITVFQFLLKLLRFSSLRSISHLSSQKLPNFSISTSVFAISSLFAEISEIAQLSCTPCDIALPLRLSLSWISSWIASTREFQVRLTASYQNLLYRLTYTDLFGTYNWLACQDIQKRAYWKKRRYMQLTEIMIIMTTT